MQRNERHLKRKMNQGETSKDERSSMSRWAGRRALKDDPLAINYLSLGNSNATLTFLEGSLSLSPCPDCDVPAADVSWKGVLGRCESANLTDLAGESSLGDPAPPAVLNDSIRRFLTDPLLESVYTEPGREGNEETRSHEAVLDTGTPDPLYRP